MLRRALSLLGLALALSSCIFLQGEVEAGAHCGFAGTTACATCVRTKCQPTVDACCDDASCRSPSFASAAPLDALDACGNGPSTTCAEELAKTRAGTPTADAMFACLKSSCRDDCLSGAKVPFSCDVPRESDQACAACIYTSCGAALDTCCKDDQCNRSSSYVKSDTFELLGACTSEDAPGCVYRAARASTDGSEGVVSRCIEESCGAACFGNYRAHQSCQLREGGQYCSCQDALASAGTECSTATGKGPCVVGKRGCQCGAYTCSRSSRECACGFDGDPDANLEVCEIADGSMGVCCLRLEDTSVTCTCLPNSTSCLSDADAKVTSCALADVRRVLEGAERWVTVCSQ